jgi:hypothetical protein
VSKFTGVKVEILPSQVALDLSGRLFFKKLHYAKLTALQAAIYNCILSAPGK